MNRIGLLMLALSLLVGWVICGYSAEQKSETAKQEEKLNPNILRWRNRKI
jgi:hypothetical protein